MYFNKSEAKTQYSVMDLEAISLVMPWMYTAQHAASSSAIPCAQKPAIIPVKTSPVPALDSAEFPV